MPIPTLEKRNSAGKSKDKKLSKNNSLVSEKSILGNNDTSSSVDGNASHSSTRDSSKDWSGSNELDDSTGNMKSILGRGSKKDSNQLDQLDPDSSSLGLEVGKEAKEKHHRSWVKTIGIRTLKRRNAEKDGKSKSHSSIHTLFSRGSSDSSKSAAAAAVVVETSGVEANTNSTGAGEAGEHGEHVKVQKTLSAASSSNGNGSDLRGKIQASTASSSSISTSTNKNSKTDANTSNISANGSTLSGGGKGSTKSKKSDASHAKVTATNSGDANDKSDPARFTGEGMSFKAKLIGVLEVSGPRGDRICQEALSELKMAVKAGGEHKQKITIHIALDGIRIRDEKTGDCLYHHQVHKISFIAQDLTDARAYGYIFGSPDMGHRFFGIKTEKSANQVVIAMRDLFQVVFDLKKKEIERAKQAEHKTSIAETYIEGACAAATPSSSSPRHNDTVDLLNLEVELNSLQEGLDNIHHNLADNNIRGSTASISSDPMNPMGVSKFSNFNSNSVQQSTTGGNTNKNFISSSGSDPFGDSFDPFDSSSGFHSQFSTSSHSQSHSQRPQSSITSPSPVAFANSLSSIPAVPADPFSQVDPFPTPKFNNFESSDPYFNADPFDTPVGNLSFSFSPGGMNEPVTSVSTNNYNNHHHNTSNSSAKSAHVDETSTSIEPPVHPSRGMIGWQASFDDNFVADSTGQPSNGSTKGLDFNFTDLDPLGTGRVKPFVDHFSGVQQQQQDDSGYGTMVDGVPQQQQQLGISSKVDKFSTAHADSSSTTTSPSTTTILTTTTTKMNSTISNSSNNNNNNNRNISNNNSNTSSSIPNSFSTNFTVSPNMSMPISGMGFDSAFKTAPYASAMSNTRKNTRDFDSSSTSSSMLAMTNSNSNRSPSLNNNNTGALGASRRSNLTNMSNHTRTDSPPTYTPPPIPTAELPINCSSGTSSSSSYAFSNNEYFSTREQQQQQQQQQHHRYGHHQDFSSTATVSASSFSSAMNPPCILPPPNSTIGTPPTRRDGSGISNKKSPQLLKQMTISSTGIGGGLSNSSSPKTLPRNARLGKQFTIDLPSSEENSPIPNLTPPPRPPNTSTLGKNMTLSTAVPRPYSAGSDKSMTGRYASSSSMFNNSSTSSSCHQNQNQPEPPPRTMATTITTVSSSSNKSVSSSLVSPPPPLPPKKQNIGPTMSSPTIILSGPSKHLYTSETRKSGTVDSGNSNNSSNKVDVQSNDLPLPLPLRKPIGAFNITYPSSATSSSNNNNRYCVPPPSSSSPKHHRYQKAPEDPQSSVAPDFVVASIPPRPDLDRDRDRKSTMTMESALQQVASMSLGQLATKLECPVEKLSNFTIQQLAEKLTMMEISSSPSNRQHTKTTASSNNSRTQGGQFGGSSRELNTTNHQPHHNTNSALGFETNFNPDFDDFSTVSAPGDFTKIRETSGHSYDKYAVFRELTVEDASGFSVTNLNENDNGSVSNNSDEETSKTFQIHALGLEVGDRNSDRNSRDSSSERTIQVDTTGFPIGLNKNSHHTNTNNQHHSGNDTANTMDDVTDQNLSDEHDDDDDKFPLDDEEVCYSLGQGQNPSKHDWATFESTFDNFAAAPPPPPSSSKNKDLNIHMNMMTSSTIANASSASSIPSVPSSLLSTPLKLTRINRSDSPWDSDEDNKIKQNEVEQQQQQQESFVYPPDPEEFDFQPFEKPTPIIPSAASTSRERERESISSLRRNSRDRDRPVFEAFELESTPLSPAGGGREPGQFTRQSSGSSKHSMGRGGVGGDRERNSDFSDSGRIVGPRSRNNSKDFDRERRVSRKDRDRGNRDKDRDRERPDSRNSYSSSTRERERQRDRDHDRDRNREVDNRNTGKVRSGESEDEFASVPFKSRESSLRRSGSGSRGGSGRKRGERRDRDRQAFSKKDSMDNNEEEDDEEEDEVGEEEEDDRSYVSYRSNYSQPQQHSRRSYGGKRGGNYSSSHRHRYHGGVSGSSSNKPTHHRSHHSLHGSRRGSPDRDKDKYSNQESDYDSYDDMDNVSSSGREYYSSSRQNLSERVGDRGEYSHRYGSREKYNSNNSSSSRRPNSGARYSTYDRDRERERTSPRDRDYRPPSSYSRDKDRDRDRYTRQHHRSRNFNGPPPPPSEDVVVEGIVDDGTSSSKREYSDYSGEDVSGMSSTSNRRQYPKSKLKSIKRGQRERERERERERDRDRDRERGDIRSSSKQSTGPAYYTNSPSWDSESQSDQNPQGGGGADSQQQQHRDSGSDRRKIRWGSSRNPPPHPDDYLHSKSPSPSRRERDKDRDRSNRQSSRNSGGKQALNNNSTSSPRGKQSQNIADFRFEDDFSATTTTTSTNHKSQLSSFDSTFQQPESVGGSHRGSITLPPQSPFEDNFVVEVNTMDSNNSAFDSIEFKRGATEENEDVGDIDIDDHNGANTNAVAATGGGDIFFPAKFDVDLEVQNQKEVRKLPNKNSNNNVSSPSPTPNSATTNTTPSSAEIIRSSPRLDSILNSNKNNVRLESIRSEEERLESSEDGADLSTETPVEKKKEKQLSEENDDDVQDSDNHNKKSKPNSKVEESGGVSKDQKEGEKLGGTSMKKSESFNIFEQEKDPFGDDDFFR